ncbi:EXLDI protein [Nonomuraea sp. JJY05]|jgi:EXLDI family protein|uniref:EXLDI protein n=1 Tax=Nonomuraea sp. JJY05 TaxID=3350255 RepID=UPI00373E52D1
MARDTTIEIAEEDLPLLARAQDLTGGTPATAISEALRRYVEAEEGRRQGYDEIVIQAAGDERRFSGVLLGEWGRTSRSGRVETFRVYRSGEGTFVLHVDRSPDWVSGSEPGDRATTWLGHLGLGERSWSRVPGEATVEAVGTIEELRGKIPGEFHDRIARIAERPALEDLDL